MKKIISFLTFFGILSLSYGQLIGSGENASLRKGNNSFRKGEFENSANHYQEAIAENFGSNKGHFNLGDAYYEQEKYEEAMKEFQTSLSLAKSPKAKAAALHNLGNTFLQQQKFKESIEAYKQALKFDPQDEDTRYNLAYAKHMLKNNPQQQNQQNQDQDQQDNKDQNQDQQNQDQQNQDQQQDQNQQNQEQQNDPEGQKQENKPMQGQNLSQKEIERMLQALKYQEDKLQQELQKKKVKTGPKVKPEKDW